MADDDLTNSGEPWQLLLVSALSYPDSSGRAVANSFKILKRALILGGVWSAEMELAGHGEPNEIFNAWYDCLIRMTREPVNGALLFEGHGNLELPAAAHFTAAYLTDKGRALAEKLLQEKPSWKD